MENINKNLTTILLTILVGLFVWQFFFSDNIIKEPTPIQVIIPEYKGTTGTQIIESVKTVPVIIPNKGEIYVDETWRNEYLSTKDSLERLNKYLQAIQINNNNYTFVDNDTINISGQLKTRGDLLEYKIDYKVKERVFEYTPKVITKRPNFSLSVEAEVGIPTTPISNFIMKGGLGFENKRGEAIIVGYDTENRVWVGLRKNFKIIN